VTAALAQAAKGLSQVATAWAQEEQTAAVAPVTTVFAEAPATTTTAATTTTTAMLLAHEDVKRKVIRELIMHENELVHQRRSHFAVYQGLLWTATSLIVRSEEHAKANTVLIYILAVLGALLALVAWCSMKMSSMAVKLLVDDLDANIRKPTPVIGLYGPLDKPKIQGRLNKLILLFNEFDIVPLTFVVTWLIFACLFLKNSSRDDTQCKCDGQR
jgi:hypothetical protein